jgi:hypothetical protein
VYIFDNCAAVTDYIFWLDMALSFRTAYFYDGGDYLVIVPSMVAKNYFKTWFAIDLMGSFPFNDVIAASGGNGEQAGFTKLLKILRLARLLKLTRLLKLESLFDELEQRTGVTPAMTDLILMLTQVFVIAHMVCCVLYGASSALTNNPWYLQNVDTVHIDQSDSSMVSKYILSLYWAFTIMSTVGYGDMLPYTAADRVVNIFVILLGASIFGYTVANVSALVQTLNSADAAEQDRLSTITSYLDEKKCSSKIQDAVLNHFRNFFKQSSAFDVDTMLSRLPDRLATEIRLLHNQNILRHIAVLKYIDNASVRLFIYGLMKPVYYEPNEYILRQHEPCNEIHFLVVGKAVAFKMKAVNRKARKSKGPKSAVKKIIRGASSLTRRMSSGFGSWLDKSALAGLDSSSSSTDPTIRAALGASSGGVTGGGRLERVGEGSEEDLSDDGVIVYQMRQPLSTTPTAAAGPGVGLQRNNSEKMWDRSLGPKQSSMKGGRKDVKIGDTATSSFKSVSMVALKPLPPGEIASKVGFRSDVQGNGGKRGGEEEEEKKDKEEAEGDKFFGYKPASTSEGADEDALPPPLPPAPLAATPPAWEMGYAATEEGASSDVRTKASTAAAAAAAAASTAANGGAGDADIGVTVEDMRSFKKQASGGSRRGLADDDAPLLSLGLGSAVPVSADIGGAADRSLSAAAAAPPAVPPAQQQQEEEGDSNVRNPRSAPLSRLQIGSSNSMTPSPALGDSTLGFGLGLGTGLGLQPVTTVPRTASYVSNVSSVPDNNSAADRSRSGSRTGSASSTPHSSVTPRAKKAQLFSLKQLERTRTQQFDRVSLDSDDSAEEDDPDSPEKEGRVMPPKAYTFNFADGDAGKFDQADRYSEADSADDMDGGGGGAGKARAQTAFSNAKRKMERNGLLPIGDLSPGDFFGHLSLMHDKINFASVVTAEFSTVYLLNKQDIGPLLSKQPTVGIQLQMALSRAISNQTDMLARFHMRQARGKFLHNAKEKFYHKIRVSPKEVRVIRKKQKSKVTKLKYQIQQGISSTDLLRTMVGGASYGPGVVDESIYLHSGATPPGSPAHRYNSHTSLKLSSSSPSSSPSRPSSRRMRGMGAVAAASMAGMESSAVSPESPALSGKLDDNGDSSKNRRTSSITRFSRAASDALHRAQRFVPHGRLTKDTVRRVKRVEKMLSKYTMVYDSSSGEDEDGGGDAFGGLMRNSSFGRKEPPSAALLRHHVQAHRAHLPLALRTRSAALANKTRPLESLPRRKSFVQRLSSTNLIAGINMADVVNPDAERPSFMDYLSHVSLPSGLVEKKSHKHKPLYGIVRVVSLNDLDTLESAGECFKEARNKQQRESNLLTLAPAAPEPHEELDGVLVPLWSSSRALRHQEEVRARRQSFPSVDNDLWRVKATSHGLV